MQHRSFRRLLLIAVLLAFPCSALALELRAKPDRADGVYEVGQRVVWTIELNVGEDEKSEAAAPATQPAGPQTIKYTLRKGGLREIETGSLTLNEGVATLETELDEPNAWLLEVQSATDEKLRARGGVVAAPQLIGPSAPRPADFDEFWASKLDELNATPADPVLEEMPAGREGVQYWHIQMNNIRQSHIQGHLARPEKGEKLPALLIVQWAGVYGLDKSWATDRAADGWLVLNIEPHDLPIDRPSSFYEEQSNGALRDYASIGNTNRETSYFLRMYLSCYRGAEYLTQRPDWDGKTLAVMGGSQGGQQALVTAGLHPRITAALANVPAGCDALGPDSGRQCGWPMWYWQGKGESAADVRETARYFDVVNFAPRITAPILVGAGLIDDVCPPAGIIAAVNLTRGPRELLLLPGADHMGEGGTHNPYHSRCWGNWLPALRKGEAAPVVPWTTSAERPASAQNGQAANAQRQVE